MAAALAVLLALVVGSAAGCAGPSDEQDAKPFADVPATTSTTSAPSPTTTTRPPTTTTAPPTTTVPPTTTPPTTTPPTTAPPVTAPPTTAVPIRPLVPQPSAAYYDNCSDARAAGVTPLHRGDPGYGSHLDRDDDGIACE